jgi:hypothetical protein
VQVVVFDEPRGSRAPSKGAKKPKDKEREFDVDKHGFDMAKMVEEAREDVARLAAENLVGTFLDARPPALSSPLVSAKRKGESVS